MENVEWDDEFATGIAEIDTQHKNIISTVNSLCNSVHNHQSKSEIKEFLEELDLYMSIHFETEENYMKQYNFPNILEHKEAHNYFRETYEQIRYSYFYVDRKNSPREEVINTYSFHLCMVLTNWIKLHFPTLDKELVEFLRERS